MTQAESNCLWSLSPRQYVATIRRLIRPTLCSPTSSSSMHITPPVKVYLQCASTLYAWYSRAYTDSRTLTACLSPTSSDALNTVVSRISANRHPRHAYPASYINGDGRSRTALKVAFCHHRPLGSRGLLLRGLLALLDAFRLGQFGCLDEEFRHIFTAALDYVANEADDALLHAVVKESSVDDLRKFSL